MKNVLLSTILVITTLIASAQTYQEYETTHGKSYLIKSKDGTYQSIQHKSRKENVKQEISFPNSAFHKVESIQSAENVYLKNRTAHHLTLNFDKEMEIDGSLCIVSDSVYYGKENLSWSEGGFKGEIDLPEDNYEIIASYDDFWGTKNYLFAFIHNLNINQNTDTTISFETMATHNLVLQCKDENNNLLDPGDTTLLEKRISIDIEFPSGYIFRSSLLQSEISSGYKFSDVYEGYKIALNQMFVRFGKLYITDLPQLSGLMKDTVLQNNPSEYKRMNMVMHASPSSSADNYLTFDYGNIYNLSGAYMCSMNGSMNEDYPYHNNDTLRVFMNNHENINNSVAAIVPNVHFWEETPLNFNFKDIVSDPFYIAINDSIVFSKYNVSAASPQFTDNCSVDLGNTVPYNYIFLKNNRYGENTIYGSCASYGEKNERRRMDNRSSVYEIKKGDEILASDTVSYFMDPFSVTEQGIYTFSVTNNNYVVNNQSGQSIFEASFDIGNADADPPVISSFKLLDAENSITNFLRFDNPGKVLLSSFDFNSLTYELNKPASVQVYYKKHTENEWIMLNPIEHSSLFDSTHYGSFFSCDLSSVLSLFTTSGYLDLKIVSADNAGNTATQILHPAAYVENNVGIPQIINNENGALQIYPNPVADNSVISFNLTQNTRIKLSVYNINGQLTDVLLDKTMGKGNHQVSWNAAEKLTSGVYLLKLETGNTVETTKVIVQ